MKKSIGGILAGILFLCQYTYAQPVCGFDQVHGRKMKADSAYRNNVLKYESNIRQYIQLHRNDLNSSKTSNSASPGKTLGTALYTIPVIVHVIHTGGAVGSIYNPTDAQITGAIDYLNQVYNGSYPGTQGAGDLQIQFAMAQRDPNCNSTNGVDRVDGSSLTHYASAGVNVTTTAGASEISVKNLSRWDPTQYYNVWVVDKIDGNDGTSGQFIAGFAYFPGGSPSYDGIIMLATQMIAGQKTLPHEIGHAFNLYHPFEGSPDKNTCPANANCNTDGDQVCDTDPITYNQLGGTIDFSCRTGLTNSCTGMPYTVGTESNYMNYTSCYTLFTNGQKVRMLASAASAARLSLSTSQGAMAPGAGPFPCVPKINFEVSADQVTETTASTSGCRSYKDYTYNMVIGSGPSITATCTLSANGGTATEGVDFDITTNGNFSAPNKAISFPAGSAASQPFTIRIYDDASVESVESFTLAFTVNSNGGNALAGNGKPTLTITINDNDVAPAVGTATGNANVGVAAYVMSASPFDAKQQSQRVQFSYKASELTAAGVPAGKLTAIALDLQKKLTSRGFTGLTIKLGNATVPYLVNGSITQGSSMTVVKSTTSYNTVAGWNNFVFDTPYTWDGTSSLVVEVCFNNAAAAAGDTLDQVLAYSDGGTASQGNIFWQNGINCSQSFSSVSYYGNGVKPIIQLTYGIPATAVQTALNSSKQEYLGPDADIYFYDQTSNKLMARIQNLSSFDYGCTQVIIDRAGTGATPFWNTTPSNYIMDKTFHVVPTNNNASGAYIITLYYTQAEVNGWQSATGQSISAIELIKTAQAISNVTPSNPVGAGAMITGSPAITTLATNTALTYNFTTGFSGFGAGFIGTVLPVTIINLEGSLQRNHVLLDWNISAGMNVRGFDVERSYNGSDFTKTGYVAAEESNTTSQHFQFSDPETAHAVNYYRLKQINVQDAGGYSKTVLIQDNVTTGFKVLNNPFTNAVDIQLGEVATGKVQARLLDVTGKELARITTGGAGFTNMHLDLSHQNITAGMYILEIWFNNKNHVARLIKE